MYLWRSRLLVKTTLFFFAAMLLFNPVYAQQGAPLNPESAVLPDQNGFPVMYVSEEEAQQLVQQFEGRGYVVREGTLAQLEELAVTVAKETQEENITAEKNTDKKSVLSR